MTDERDSLRIHDHITILDRGEDRIASTSGLTLYSKDGGIKHVDNQGRAVRSLADDAFGWIMNNVMSTTTSSPGSVTFEYDRIELREPGQAASKSQTRFYNGTVGVDPSLSGSIRVDLDDTLLLPRIDDNASARIYVQLSDTADGNGMSGDDYLAAEVRGDGEVRAHTSEGGTSGNTKDTSQNNTYVQNLNYIEVDWDGSTCTVTVSNGSTEVTVSDSSNYPIGENLHLAVKAEDQDGSNQRNVDYDVTRISRT